ncbi:TlpA disulfide reductase family protein [Thermomonas sp.]|uniref:TlpA family protein disulfide reductase n=1 Tax=Thermomonas sp. TaxID=1971895 RepID=UPI002487AD60|nr:TlpA disulfide reductase family protein [Thermomonas sp.]MDI1252586.1 TlpA disulfide reductase family protein [Thermomonas sp.]
MNKSNLRIVLVAVVAALAGAGASVYFDPTIATRLASTEPGQRVLGAVLKSRAPTPPEGVIVAERGDIVPAMTLADASGASTRIPKAWAGKPTLVNLWATWCAPCLKEMPELQAFADEQSANAKKAFAGEQGANGIQVIGIALDDATNVRDFLQQHRISYPTLVDAPGPADAGVRLGNPAGVLPYTILVSAEGRLLKTKIGPFDDKRDIEEWAKP